LDNEYNVLFSASFADEMFNKLANNFILNFAEDDGQKTIIENLLKAFNKHGVPSFTVLQALADAFKEGGFENG